MSNKGFSSLVCSRDLLIDGLVNVVYLETAKAMVRRMTKEPILPEVSTFNSLLEALTQAWEVYFCVLLKEAGDLGLWSAISTMR